MSSIDKNEMNIMSWRGRNERVNVLTNRSARVKERVNVLIKRSK